MEITDEELRGTFAWTSDDGENGGPYAELVGPVDLGTVQWDGQPPSKSDIQPIEARYRRVFPAVILLIRAMGKDPHDHVDIRKVFVDAGVSAEKMEGSPKYDYAESLAARIARMAS